MEKQGEKYDRYSYEELSAFCLQIALCWRRLCLWRKG